MQERRNNAASPSAQKAQHHSIELGSFDSAEGETETASLVQDAHGSPAKLKDKGNVKDTPSNWLNFCSRYFVPLQVHRRLNAMSCLACVGSCMQIFNWEDYCRV